MERLEALVDYYAHDKEKLQHHCKVLEHRCKLLEHRVAMMERMLDADYVVERMKLLGESEIYIYGGGYLGIQFFRSIRGIVKVFAVIDKSGKTKLDDSEIPVIDLVQFRSRYNDEIIIITPITFYREIRLELSEFIPQDRIRYIGDVLGVISNAIY